MPSSAAGLHARSPRLLTIAFLTVLLTALFPTAQADARGVTGAEDRDVIDLGLPPIITEVPIHAELSPSVAYLLFTNTDMRNTYRGLYLYGLETSVGISSHGRFFLSGAYGRSDGNPFHGEKVFEGGIESELACVPFRIGLRANISQHPRFHLYLGVAWTAAWIREKVPESLFGDQVIYEEYTGIGKGIGFQIFPQWRSPSGRTSIGFEFAFGGPNAELDSESDGHLVKTSGLAVRFAIGRRL
jgi:hypothetical protein